MTRIEPQALQYVLTEARISGLCGHYRGKVRDNYDLADARRLLIASDRLSAFDQVLTAIPFKGQVLTQTAKFWFDNTTDICANHVIAYPDPCVLLARRLKILPVEIVVRGYLAGTTATSILTMYRAGQREMYGIRLPEGMADNEVLPAPIITPTSKADDGGHDAPLTPEAIIGRGLLSERQWQIVSTTAHALFARGQQIAASRGLILADTKYEFGTDTDGQIVLADEIHTPDSSRYWLAASYDARVANAAKPESFDKDFVRAWVAERCDPYRDPIPTIPAEMILRTAQVYIDAYETITGETFLMPDLAEPPLQRILRNLSGFLSA